MSYPNYPNYPGYPASTGGYPPSTGGYPQQPQPGYPNQVGIAVFLLLFIYLFIYILFYSIFFRFDVGESFILNLHPAGRPVKCNIFVYS
jgi:hypothetical protein